MGRAGFGEWRGAFLSLSPVVLSVSHLLHSSLSRVPRCQTIRPMCPLGLACAWWSDSGPTIWLPDRWPGLESGRETVIRVRPESSDGSPEDTSAYPDPVGDVPGPAPGISGPVPKFRTKRPEMPSAKGSGADPLHIVRPCTRQPTGPLAWWVRLTLASGGGRGRRDKEECRRSFPAGDHVMRDKNAGDGTRMQEAPFLLVGATVPVGHFSSISQSPGRDATHAQLGTVEMNACKRNMSSVWACG